MLPLIAPLLIGVAAPVAPPCLLSPWNEVALLGPGPSESGVPLNASVWARFRLTSEPVPTLHLRHADTGAEVPTHQETLYEWNRQGDAVVLREVGVRLVPDADLEPRHRYSVDWTFLGAPNGHVFDTGDARDDAAPDPPTIDKTLGTAPIQGCSASYGVTVWPSGDTSLLYVARHDGADAGIERGPPVDLITGAPSTQVVGELIAMDLAGNRSASGAAFQGNTPKLLAPNGRYREPTACSSAPLPSTGGLALALMLLTGWARARASRARGGSARGPTATSP